MHFMLALVILMCYCGSQEMGINPNPQRRGKQGKRPQAARRKTMEKIIAKVEEDLGRKLSKVEINAAITAAVMVADRRAVAARAPEAWSRHWKRVLEDALRYGAEPYLRKC